MLISVTVPSGCGGGRRTATRHGATSILEGREQTREREEGRKKCLKYLSLSFVCVGVCVLVCVGVCWCVLVCLLVIVGVGDGCAN